MEKIIEEIVSLAKNDDESKEFLASLKSGENGEFLPEEQIAERLKGAIKAKFDFLADRHYGKGKKESLSAFEKAIREKYAFESDKKGEELIEELIKAKSAAPPPTTPDQKFDPAKLDRTTLITLPAVKDLLREEITKATQEEAQKVSQVKAEFDKYREGITLRLVSTKAKEQGAAILRKERAKLGATPDEESRILDFFFGSLDYRNLRLENDNNLTVLNEKGEPKENQFFQPVSFEAWIKEVWPFGFHQFDPNKGSGSPTTQHQGSGGGKYPPGTYEAKDRADLAAYMRREPDKKKKEAAFDWFAEKLSKATA